MKTATRPVLLVGAAFSLFFSAGMSAHAQSGDESTESSGGAAATRYELRDEGESVPLNYRSNEDPRYDTKEQRDAEMYAEQYEKQRAEEDAKQKQFLDKLNKTPRGNGLGGGNVGTIQDGFPAH